jgi:thiol-disulfide isomerase/thioredoxin
VPGKVSKMKKVILLITACFLFYHAVAAQTGTKVEVVPDKVMDAEFRALDENAAPIRLAVYKNRVAVIFLWASWCGPCRMAAEKLNRLNKSLMSRGVEIIGLTVDDPETEADDLRSLVRNLKISFQIGWINKEMFEALTPLGTIPQIYVIAGDGVIVKKFIGWHPEKTIPSLTEAVEQVLINPPVRQ